MIKCKETPFIDDTWKKQFSYDWEIGKRNKYFNFN